jgi:hypothetical protein
MRATLAAYDRVPQQSQVYADTLGTPREVFFWLLTLECGVEMARAQLHWIESVIERLQNKTVPPPEG